MFQKLFGGRGTRHFENKDRKKVANDINKYAKQLNRKEIQNGAHREFVGGLWEEVGQLQIDFLRSQHLNPAHKFLDVGCGCLRGGIHIIRYLDAGNYYGLDINQSLIEAGKIELRMANLLSKKSNLLVNDKFEFSLFGTTFEFGLAVSVFTHLPMNHIVRCLVNIKRVLSENGKFYATYFEAPYAAHLDQIRHHPGNALTNYDADCYHYSFNELEAMANLSGLDVKILGDWGHPRDQRMCVFSIK